MAPSLAWTLPGTCQREWDVTVVRRDEEAALPDPDGADVERVARIAHGFARNLALPDDLAGNGFRPA